jgi:nitroreductase
MLPKRAETSVPILEPIANRWSGRAIDPDRPVRRLQLLALLEAARWAPSCFGDEPWRYIVWDRGRGELGWQKAFDCLSTGNQLWAKNAPVLMLSLAGSRFRKTGKTNRWAQHDTGAASENLCLQGLALGLVVHQMGGFNAARSRSSFSIPPEFEPMAMIAVGHPAPVDSLDPDIREKELAARHREPLELCFFEDRWGSPIARRFD